MNKAAEIYKRLLIRAYQIDKVYFGGQTAVEGKALCLDSSAAAAAAAGEQLVEKVEIEILPPGCLGREVYTILDIIPVAAKVLGRLGEGITHTLTGVYFILTAADASGRPLAQFGSSAGVLKDKLKLGRPGTPGEGDRIILCQATIAAGAGFKREGIMAVHRAADSIIQQVRDCLKGLDGKGCTEEHLYVEKPTPGRKKVVLVKLLAGQGAMHDNLVLPIEPCGFKGGHSIIDLANMPLLLTPNEYRDGALKAMT